MALNWSSHIILEMISLKKFLFLLIALQLSSCENEDISNNVISFSQIKNDKIHNDITKKIKYSRYLENEVSVLRYESSNQIFEFKIYVNDSIGGRVISEPEDLKLIAMKNFQLQNDKNFIIYKFAYGFAKIDGIVDVFFCADFGMLLIRNSTWKKGFILKANDSTFELKTLTNLLLDDAPFLNQVPPLPEE